jgi:hypothetical protein
LSRAVGSASTCYWRQLKTMTRANHATTATTVITTRATM